MKTLWILILLLVVNLGWALFNLHQSHSSVNASFKVAVLRTNDVSGIGIYEVKTQQPIWTQWDANHNGKPSQENFFFHGEDVFDITLSGNHPPTFSVYFRGPGKSVTWWLNREGADTFTERIFYDTNGVPSKHEIWYDNTWSPVERRNEKNGIIVGGQWHQLAFDTNGMWTIEAP